MKDFYKKLSTCLDTIINLIKEYQQSKNDFIKPDIRAYQVQMLNFAKVIGNNVLKHVDSLNDDLDEYLAEPSDDKYQNLMHDALKVKNDLWEL